MENTDNKAIPNSRYLGGITSLISLAFGLLLVSWGLLTLYIIFQNKPNYVLPANQLHIETGVLVDSSQIAKAIPSCDANLNGKVARTPKVVLLTQADGGKITENTDALGTGNTPPLPGETKSYQYDDTEGPCLIYNSAYATAQDKADKPSFTLNFALLLLGIFLSWLSLGRRRKFNYDGEPEFFGYYLQLNKDKDITQPYSPARLTVKKNGSIFIDMPKGAQTISPEQIRKVKLNDVIFGMFDSIDFILNNGSRVLFSPLSPEDFKKAQSSLNASWYARTLAGPGVGVAAFAPEAVRMSKREMNFTMPLLSVLWIRLRSKVTIFQTDGEKALYIGIPILGLLVAVAEIGFILDDIFKIKGIAAAIIGLTPLVLYLAAVIYLLRKKRNNKHSDLINFDPTANN